MNQKHMNKTLLAATLVLCLPLSAPSQAQEYPNRAITFVVPFGAGSATDQFTRAIGQGVTEQTKQVVVIENKPGASAMIGASDVARAEPDGYKVLFTTNTSQAANPHLYRSEEHTSELQSLMRISYAVFCLKKKINKICNK